MSGYHALAACLALLALPNAARADGGFDFIPAYEQCKLVSDDPTIADRENGICITATRAFVATLPQPGNSESDQALTDFVTKLSQLPWHVENHCDHHEDEIPDALRFASAALVDQDQARRIRDVADTLSGNCGDDPAIPVNAPASSD